MLKKVVLGCLLFFAIPLPGQTPSPLHQVMSTNSLIDRPLIFRELQGGIRDDLGNVEPGLEIELLYNKFSDFRAELMSYIETPDFSYRDSDSTVVITFREYEKALSLNVVLRTGFLIEIEAKLSDTLKDKVNLSFKTLKLKEQRREAILKAAISALQKAGFKPPRWNPSDNYLTKFSKFTANILISELRQKMKSLHPDLDLDEITEAKTRKWVTVLDDLSQETAQSVRSKLSEALDAAEHEIVTIVDEFSRWLIAANAGLAVTEGPEGFSGGLQLSYVWSTKFQTGIYVNGEFSERKGKTISSVSTRMDTLGFPAQSLVGVQARWAKDVVQVDALFSALFANSGFKSWRVFEFGGGVSFRVKNTLILGFEYFRLEFLDHGMKDERFIPFQDVNTFGVSFKGLSAGSPTLLFGGIFEDGGSLKPVFQVSFPLIAKR